MRKLIVAGMVLAFATDSFATTSELSTEKLLGWSEDGEHYAVLVTAEPDESQEIVVRRGKTRVKSIDQDDAGMEETDTYTALERVNIETSKHLKEFGLKRVNASWRKGFKAAFTLAKIRPSKKDDSACKAVGWKLLRTRDKTVVHTFRSRGCVTRVAGGYLHPGGKRALIKFTETYWETGAHAVEVEDTRYLMVEIK